MPRNWTALAENSAGLYTVQDFESAAYQLMSAQILYEQEHTQRLAYALICRYRSEFTEVFRLFGLDLQFRDNARYVAAVPDRGNHRAPLTLQETQLVLVLRKLYHEQAKRMELEDGLLAVVTIDELRSAFLAATQRELPTTAREIGALIDQMQRFGIAKQVKGELQDVQPFNIAILAGIETLVNEATLLKLSAHYEAAAALARLKSNGESSARDGAAQMTSETGEE
jgi:hypothetical protein